MIKNTYTEAITWLVTHGFTEKDPGWSDGKRTATVRSHTHHVEIIIK